MSTLKGLRAKVGKKYSIFVKYYSRNSNEHPVSQGNSQTFTTDILHVWIIGSRKLKVRKVRVASLELGSAVAALSKFSNWSKQIHVCGVCRSGDDCVSWNSFKPLNNVIKFRFVCILYFLPAKVTLPWLMESMCRIQECKSLYSLQMPTMHHGDPH